MKLELTKIGSALKAFLRKENKMATRLARNNTSDLRDRIASLERELKNTQDRVQKDIKNLYEIVQSVTKRENQ